MSRLAFVLLLSATGCTSWDGAMLETPEGRWRVNDPEGIDMAEKWVRIEWLSGPGPAKGNLMFIEMKSDSLSQSFQGRDPVRRKSIYELKAVQSEESLRFLRGIFEKYGRAVPLREPWEMDETFEGPSPRKR